MDYPNIIEAFKNSINEFTFPFVIASATIVITSYLFYIKSKYKNEYKQDKYRHELEYRVMELSKELAITQERFSNVNHLLLDGGLAQNKTKDQNGFLEQFNIKDKNVDNELIFVLMPFNPKLDDIFETLKNTVKDVGFKCSRGDDSTLSQNILGHIVQQIIKARFVVAIITGRNPNVYYELGIAHALGKEVLLVSETVDDIPFDIKSNRVLLYKSKNDLENNLKKWLIQTLAKLSNQLTN